jgi:hypothetical protein
MIDDDILKKYVCRTPFVYMEAHKNGVFSCCPSWLPKKISTLEDIENAWSGEELKKIQDSILDGSYAYCSKTECPYLSSLITTKVSPQDFVLKEHFKKEDYVKGPTNINFAFDRSCNLSCPSCRVGSIMADGKEIEFIDSQIDKICKKYGSNLTMFYLSGSADPFASKSIRKFLLTFDKSKFPKLKAIHLHTNGILLNEKMWNSLEHIHDFIKTIEISVDAATEETYKIARRGGDWKTLIDNLHFIANCNSIKKVRTSFVVQDINYTEMDPFYNLMNGILGKKCEVYYNKITNWGTYTDGEFFIKQIWNESHPEFNNFLNELNKVSFNTKCIHNMHDIVKKHRLKKKLTILI